MASQITIHPPLAGIVRSRGFQRQAPFSCREAVNFWPQFAIDGSETLAIRPPLDQWLAVATHPVNLLCRVNGTTSQTPQRTFVAAVNGQLQRWTGSALTNVGGAGSVPTGRAVFAAAFEQKVYIPASTSLVYDYPSDTLSTWTASDGGTLPADMRILVFWAGGLWGAAQPNAPHIVSGSATGNPLNWNFAASGEGAAFQTTGDNAGLINDPVTALIPVSGDTMIVSTPDGMQAWRGHPRRGGVADVLSSTVGVRGQGAWCQGPDGTIYAITNKGLSAISNGASAVSHISRDRIPNELIGFDYDYLNPRIAMAFDNRFNGIHITVRDGNDSEAWFYDLKNGGLFQAKYAQYPHVMLPFDPIESGRASGVLFGGSGGLFRFDLDGAETISEARVVLGPLRLSANAMERSKITEAQVVMGGGTTAVDAALEFYCGPTADSAYAASVSGRAAAKYQTTVDRTMAAHGRIRPMIAGHACTVVFNHAAEMENPKLVMEEINLRLEPAGKERAYVLHSDTTGPRAGTFIPPPRPSALYAYYTLNESSGARADSTPFGHTLTESNGTIGSTTGRIGSAASFVNANGSTFSELVHTSSPISTQVTDGITIWAWVKTGNGNIGAGSDTRVLIFQPAGHLYALDIVALGMGAKFTARTGGSETSVTKTVDLEDGGWHLLVGVYDPVGGEIRIGIDNEFETSSSLPPAGGSAATSNIVVHQERPFSEYAIDEAGILIGALTTSQTTALWNGGAGQTYPLELD